jgi:CheY-like chemotaxis protein
LSQVYGFARQSGGHVAIDSAPGAGTTVTIYIPVAQDMPAAHPAEPPAADVVSFASATVLMVEDDMAVLEATAEVLRDAGWRVLTARDGAAALRILEGDEAIDVLFSDVVMPGGISGPELARQARRLRPAVGVLLATGYAGDQPAGDLDVLVKPYERGKLLACLAQAAAARDASAAA